MAEEKEKAETGTALEETAEAVTKSVAGLARKLSDWLHTKEWIPDGVVQPMVTGVLLVGLLLLAWITFVVFRPLILRWVNLILDRSKVTWGRDLVGHGVFRWLTHLLPGIVIYLLAPGLFESSPGLAAVLATVAKIYLLLSGYFVIDSLLNALRSILGKTGVGQHLNLTSIAQILKLVAALIVFLLVLAVVLQKQPFAILGGLGILASVLMLVFKDVILGFVAGIQLASNRMLSRGDWLEMPSHGADGDVLEIGLTTVKVQNWDKTITTIPTHALITDSFKNWRGMSESGGRRIKRSLLIDTNSIRLCSADMLKSFHEIEHISEYLDRKEKEIAEYNASLGKAADASRVNGRRLTNVGTFRAYMEAYLRNHPRINQDMTLLVRQLASEGRGLPIQIYCFTATTDWAEYEGIRSDIFDHFFAVAPEFGLRVFQEPAGTDIMNAIHREAEGSSFPDTNDDSR